MSDAESVAHGNGTAHNAQRSRHQLIAEAVIKRGSMRVEDLSALTGASLMTTYRDISALESVGIVQRQRGVVLAVASSLQEAPAGFRLGQNAEVKASMAAALATRVRQGSSLGLDDSTSGVWLLRALSEVSNLTVVTNSLLVAQEIEGRDDVHLHMTGGEYQPWAQALMGPATVSFLADIHTDWCVLSASGIVEGTCLHPYADVASVKRAMLASATTKVLMADHTKFRRQALHSFARVDDFDIVVVDAATPDDIRHRLLTSGVDLIIADQ